MRRPWDEIQAEFRLVVLRRGDRTVNQVANEIPADRATVYRLIDGTTKAPHLALREAVERYVSRMRRPDESDTSE